MSGDRMSEVEWRVHVRRDGSYLLIDAESEDGNRMSMNIPENLARSVSDVLSNSVGSASVDYLRDAVWNEGNPWTWSTEGLDDGCFYCGRDVPRGLHTPTGVEATADGMHDPDCPWLAVALEVTG